MKNINKQIQNPNYRPDIDGLRAIAVLSVVIFHAFPNELSFLGGGFVGVDIFFVISGFLISSILFKNLDSTGSVNLYDFYSKRIRRIFPSLILCLTFCLIVGYFILLPNEYKNLGKHVAGGAGYVSNLVLLFEQGYFDDAATFKPLLHLWSLGIEEQFYIVWPLLLALCYKRVGISIIVLLLLLVSFYFNVDGIHHQKDTVFFSPHTRFWELLVGCTLAYLCRYKKDHIQRVKVWVTLKCVQPLLKNLNKENMENFLGDILSLLGIFLIILSILCVNNKNFPGYQALLPTVGTALVIGSGRNSLVGRLISNKFFVFIGLISYPLYIWHWPLISMSWIVESGEPNIFIRLTCVAAAFFLAWLTYRFVEPYFRWGNFPRIKASLLFFTMLVIGVTGFQIYRSDEFIRDHMMKINKATLASSFETNLRTSRNRCLKFFPDWTDADRYYACNAKLEEGKNQIAIIGSSFAEHLYPGIEKLLPSDKGVIMFRASSTPPFIDIVSADDKELEHTRKGVPTIKRGIQYIVEHDEISTVILSSHQGIVDYAKDLNSPTRNSRDALIAGMERTIELLQKHGKRIFIVIPNPWLPMDPRKCIKRPFRLSNSNVCTYDRSLYERQTTTRKYAEIVSKIAKRYQDITVLDLSSILCDSKMCRISDDSGDILYRDKAHFNLLGSLYVAPYILESIGLKTNVPN